MSWKEHLLAQWGKHTVPKWEWAAGQIWLNLTMIFDYFCRFSPSWLGIFCLLWSHFNVSYFLIVVNCVWCVCVCSNVMLIPGDYACDFSRSLPFDFNYIVLSFFFWVLLCLSMIFAFTGLPRFGQEKRMRAHRLWKFFLFFPYMSAVEISNTQDFICRTTLTRSFTLQNHHSKKRNLEFYPVLHLLRPK